MQILEGRQINGRWYLTTTPIANWNYRKQMLKDGLGYVVEDHPRGKIIKFVKLDMLVEVGIDTLGNEALPRHAFKFE